MNFVADTLNRAVRHHQEGRFGEAESLYRQVLRLQPDQPDALHLLGVLTLQSGNAAGAAELIAKAIKHAPNDARVNYNYGNALASAGRFSEAASAYRKASTAEPRYVEAHANLGAALARLKQFEPAVASLRRAIALNPAYVPAYVNLAGALFDSGRFAEAAASFSDALARGAVAPEIHAGLARALVRIGRAQEAAEGFRRALAMRPDDAAILRDLGATLLQLGQHDEAASYLENSLRLKPDDLGVHIALAVTRESQGRPDEAETLFRRALAIDPRCAEAHNRLGLLLLARGDKIGAANAFSAALAAAPDFAEAHCNMARIAIESGQLAEGIAHCERAIMLKPDLAEAHNNLALARKMRAEIAAAITGFQKAQSLRADYPAAESNLLVALHYDPSQRAAAIRDAHQRWGEKIAARVTPLAPPENSRDPDRRLRTGYVSADFLRHPVGYFLDGVLANHARERVETFCYSGVTAGDDMTAELRAHAAQWRDVAPLDDAALARLIRADEIDLLVDLSGHTGGNRLGVFARKPAPLQLTWAGYVGTTGLATMDYLVADRFHVPEDKEALYGERILRLPHGYVCYTPPPYAPPVGPLPAITTGAVTFGSFNYPGKLNDDVLITWSGILAAVPGSRLLLKYRGLDDPTMRARIAELFASRGVSAERLIIEGPSRHADLLARYNDVDIALDTFPYSGGLTTLEALWMGVPVITFPGERFASRHSLSHLSNVGLTETIGTNRGEYIERAVALAQDVAHLAALRAGLRERMARSPVCNTAGFTRDFEEALRTIWRRWCTEQSL